MKIGLEEIRERANLAADGSGDGEVVELILPGQTGAKISHLPSAALAPFADSLHTLDLSRNEVANLEGLFPLTALTSLKLYYNKIPDLDALDPLRLLPKLSALDLRLNPVSKSGPDYRLNVIARLPGLLRLDERDIRSSEKRAAARISPPPLLPPELPAPASPPLRPQPDPSSPPPSSPSSPSVHHQHRTHPAPPRLPPSPSVLQGLIEVDELPPTQESGVDTGVGGPVVTRRRRKRRKSSISMHMPARDATDLVVHKLLDVLGEGPLEPEEVHARFRHVLLEAKIPASEAVAPPAAAAAGVPLEEVQRMREEHVRVQAESSSLAKLLASEQAHAAQLAETVGVLNTQVATLSSELAASAGDRQALQSAVSLLQDAHARLAHDNDQLRVSLAAQKEREEELARVWRANFDELLAYVPDPPPDDAHNSAFPEASHSP